MTYGISECIIIVCERHTAFVKTVSENDIVGVVFVLGKSTFRTISHSSASPVVTILKNAFIHSNDHLIGSAEGRNAVRAGDTGPSVFTHRPTWWTFTDVCVFAVHGTVMSATTIVDIATSIKCNWFWDVQIVPIFRISVIISITIFTAASTSFYEKIELNLI